MSDIDVLRSNDSIDERLIEEIEALEAILLDEILIKTNESPGPGIPVFPVVVESVVLPSTAADAEQQYVRVTVSLGLPTAYPDESPHVTLRNPRGLADEVLSRIEEDVKLKCDDFRGQPVIYEIIELVKEHLTSSNCPSCVCAVCLYEFQQGDAFSKTECFHYFHSHCLACYVRTTQRTLQEEREKLPLWQQQQMQKDRLNLQKEQQDEDFLQVPCPVCREPISADLDALSSAPPPIALEAAPPFELTNELRALQHQMAALYLHQKSQGGIIDVNADQSKLLLLTSGSAESTRNSGDVASSARSSSRQSGSEQNRASKSIRGSSWSNAGNQPKRSWKVRSEPPSQVVNSSKGMPPVQSELGLGDQESFERPFPEGQDAEGESRECIKGGEGWRNGGRGGRGGRWSYHRSRGRRASRGRLRMACNLAPSS